MLKALVFEPSHSGHRFVYLKHALPAMAEHADELVLVTHRDAQATEEFDVCLAPIRDRFTLDDRMAPEPSAGTGRIARHKADALRDAVARHRPDHVLIAFGDGLLQWLAWRHGWLGAPLSNGAGRPGPRVEAIVHRTRFSYQAANLKARALRALARRAMTGAGLSRLHFVDALEYEHVQPGPEPWPQLVAMLPDPVPRFDRPPSRAEARERLGLRDDRPIVGCVGYISEGKGVPRLIEAMRAGGLGGRARLLLVGKHDDASRAAVAAMPDDAVVSRDHFADDDELMLALAASDLICVARYGHIGISSIVLRAAIMQRPVLAENRGWCGWIVPRFALGWTTHTGRVDDLAAGLADALLNRAASWRPGPGLDALTAFHAPTNFAAHLARGLVEHRGLGPDAAADQLGCLTWPTVKARAETTPTP